MGIGHLFFSIFRFLSSFIGTLLIIGGLYFFVNKIYLIPLLIGFLIITLFILIKKSNFNKGNAKLFAKRMGLRRSHRQEFAKSMQNRFLSGYIARAFLISFFLTFYYQYLMMPLIIFSGLVIFSTMKYERTSLAKIILSALLGSISGLMAVILSIYVF